MSKDKEECDICGKMYVSVSQHKRSAHSMTEDGPNDLPITEVGRLQQMAQNQPILAKRKRDLYLKSAYVVQTDDEGVETTTKATLKQKALRNGRVTNYFLPNGKFLFSEPAEEN